MGALAVAMTLRAKVRKHFGSGFLLDIEEEFGPAFHILFGASGAGKTTLLDCLAGLMRPDEGRVAFNDEVLFDRSINVDIPTHLRRVGYVFQSHALFPHLTVRQNIGFGVRDTDVNELMQQLDLVEFADRKPGQLSAGQRERVALARTLAANPRYVLMDEPLGALDANTKSEMVKFLRQWNARHEVPIVYVTHDREEAYGLGERLLVMEEGKIVASGPPHEVFSTPRRNTAARLAGFENLLRCEVVSEHPDSGTMSCRVSGTEVVVEVPLTHVQNSTVTLGVRAGDILVAAEQPRAISARNVLVGEIESIEQRRVLVRLFVNVRGAKFEAHITPGARVALGLSGGKGVWLVIKTYACHLLNE